MNRGLFALGLLILTSCQPRILTAVSSSYAKEFCSCHFVEKQSKSYCERYATQMLPISHYEIKEDSIIATGFNRTSTAQFKSPQLGCVLTTHPKV